MEELLRLSMPRIVLASALMLLAFRPAVARAAADAGLDAGFSGDGGEEITGEYEAEEAEADEPLDSLDPEAESANAGNSGGYTDGGLLYTTDLSDDALLKQFVTNLPALGSISVGLAEAGRLINGVQMTPGDAWSVVSPDNAWGTRETIVYLSIVARAVQEQFPYVAPLRVNHIGKQEGGYLRPHHSHQSGRDADLGFYYRAGMNPLMVKGPRENAMDLPANWALVRALATRTDTQVILLDRRVQKVLYDYALSIGEDRVWLDSLFNAGRSSLLQHVRRHRDHFHVRFYSPRSQELGWRIQPLLAKRSDENFVIHRIKKGDTLGHLAMRYGSGVKLIQRANGLSSINLRVGRTLNIPLRGPCTKCPLPPRVVVPPRRAPISSRGMSLDAGIL
jgi:murein endopeptidase